MRINKKVLKKLITDSGLFDEIYYLKNNQDVRLGSSTSIDHYCKIGIKADFKLNASFDPVWYREFYQDVQENRAFPIVHYISHGLNENRYINQKEKDEYEVIQGSGIFDAVYYQEINEDLHELGNDFNFLLHYIRFGIQENRKPNADFDPTWYIEFYQDVQENGVYPIFHYILHGLNEHRFINQNEKDQYELIQGSGIFDSIYYQEINEDLHELGNDFNFLLHYIRFGIQENRNPNVDFDPIWYLGFYPDVKEDGIFPIIHYILHGLNENRFINQKEKDEYEVIQGSGLFDEIYYLKKQSRGKIE